ncbi:MAG TPA: hypothetical protein VF331_11375 [Polyangiales bacterium]
MSKSRRPTLEHSPLISLVVIGGPDALIEAAKHVTETATNARVVATDLPSAATKVARARPFAIVLSEEIYAFDSAEFDALARDVRAELIALPTDGVPVKTLQQRLLPLVVEAFRAHFRDS